MREFFCVNMDDDVGRGDYAAAAARKYLKAEPSRMV